jgi:hypothetical protein
VVVEKQEVKLQLPEVESYGSGGLVVSFFLKKEVSI